MYNVKQDIYTYINYLLKTKQKVCVQGWGLNNYVRINS